MKLIERETFSTIVSREKKIPEQGKRFNAKYDKVSLPNTLNLKSFMRKVTS